MLTGDIIVLEHNVGLLAIAQSLHILLSYLRERFIGQLLVWMGIERAMEDSFLCSTLFGYQCLHIYKYLRHRIFARTVLVQAMCQQKCCFLLIYILEVVAECPSEVLRC